jgi:hypothetical protein
MELESIKNEIERMDREQHIYIAELLIRKHITDNDENKNGIFINLTNLKPEVITDLKNFIKKQNEVPLKHED